MKTFFVPGNVPSLKNSKSMVPGKGIFVSKAVAKYLRDIGIKSYSTRMKTVVDYLRKPNIFRKSLDGFSVDRYPAKIGFHFVRQSNRRFDFDNAVAILGDLLTAHGFIKDDDIKHMIPFPVERSGEFFTVDPKNPGVYISIIED